jgi:hypothetical protein
MHSAPSPPESCISATLDSSQFAAILIVPACFLGKARRSCSFLFVAFSGWSGVGEKDYHFGSYHL